MSQDIATRAICKPAVFAAPYGKPEDRAADKVLNFGAHYGQAVSAEDLFGKDVVEALSVAHKLKCDATLSAFFAPSSAQNLAS